jgi:sugar phosphate isomerase/epimerase
MVPSPDGSSLSADRKWGRQVKSHPAQPEELFKQAVADGLSVLEFRAPTRNGHTVPETDFAGDRQTVGLLRTLSREYSIELAYHAPQGDTWQFGQLPFRTSLLRLEECVTRAASFGAHIMTLHVGLDGTDRVRSIRRVAKVLQVVAPRAEECGVLLCVENVFGNCSVADVEDCALLFDIADAEQVHLTLDTGHANLRGCLFEMIGIFHNRLAFTHLHDNDGTQDQHLVPGNGTVDWARLMRGLTRYSYTGPLSFEVREECSYPQAIAMLERMSCQEPFASPQRAR